MNDLQAAAERFRSAERDSAFYVYDNDTQANTDAHNLAGAYVDLCDSALLKDLTREQWVRLIESLGQKLDSNGNVNLKIGEMTLTIYHYSTPEITAGNNSAYYGCNHSASLDNVKTIGQLRHLVAALGGEQ